jgi:DNA repair exonuclease SbcCD ATPase subunit
MANSSRGSGTMTIVALAVLIVLTIVGIGTSIWFFQQMSISKQATLANQNAFETQIASFFNEHDWDITHQTRSEYGIKYNEDSYKDVAEKLQKAADLEAMSEDLGWKQPGEVERALQQNQPPNTKLSTVKALLEHYSRELPALNSKVEELNNKLEHSQDLLADRRRELSELQEKFAKEKEDILKRHTESIAKLTSQYEEMVKLYQEARAELKDCQDRLDEARKQWEQEKAQLKAEAANWHKLYQQEKYGQVEDVELQPEGKILSLDPEYNFVIVEGGKDMDRKPDTRLVIYRESPDGKITIKGRATISKVNDTTSLALIASQEERLAENDLFTTETQWEAYKEFQTQKQTGAEQE